MSPLLALLALQLSTAMADGRVVGVIFDGPGGAPAVGLRVSTSAGAAETDRDGAFVLSLPAGTWTLQLSGARSGSVVVEVREGGTTEVLVAAFADGRAPLVTVETPAAPGGAARPADENTVLVDVVGLVRSEDGQPLQGARVFVRGSAAEALTDSAGRFTLSLPAGVHTLSVLRSGYATRTLGELSLPLAGGAPIEVELVEAGVALDDFAVMVPRLEGDATTLLAERQASSGVTDSVSAEEMRRRGDSSAAAALGRVTGLTVVGGKYVYVRGMGERYSATLLNGSSLPSPEPERRVVPLDLFPTSMLESVVIQKTFSPSMPAEFGGGAVQLRTRGIPEEPLFETKLSGRFTQGTTFQRGPLALPGAQDFFGVDDGGRAMPKALAEATEDQKLVLESKFKEGFSADELESLGESLGSERWKLGSTLAMPDMGASATAGGGVKVGENSELGALVGFNFTNAWERRSYEHRYLNTRDGELVLQNRYDFDDLTNTARLGAMGVLEAKLAGNHNLRSTTLLVRDTENMARRYTGSNDDFGANIRVSRVDWVERQLFLEQLAGEHRFPALGAAEFDWRASMSRASRDEPDRRDLIMEQSTTSGDWFLRTQGGGNGLLFSGLSDENMDGGVDLRLPWGAREGEEDRAGGFGGKVAVGGAFSQRAREVSTRRFSYDVVGGGEGSTDFVYNADPSQVFSDENIRADGLRIAETTLPTDNFTASAALAAQYVELDLRFPWAMQMMTGVRREVSRQTVSSRDLFSDTVEPENTLLYRVDMLPAFTLTQGMLRDRVPGELQVRGGYGRTLNRPDFRELSPAVYYDVVGGRETTGEPTLERAIIDNFDLRWEWYPSPSESLSFGAFYKQFQDPIESTVVASIASRQTYTNAAGATNAGLELDMRKTLGETGAWQDLSLSGNAALIRSRVDLRGSGGTQTNNVRPLQGQSPYVVNLQLAYEPLDKPISAALLLNRSGKRILDVGAEGIPDEIEQARTRLDAVAGMGLGPRWRVDLNGRNLLNSPVVRTVGGQEVRVVEEGWSVGAALGWQANRR
jgi:hypothetical protein